MAWVAKADAEQHYSAFNAETVGPSTLFLSAFPIVISVAVQAANIHAALIAGTAIAGVVVALGFVLYWVAARRIGLYILDATILIALVVQLGVSYRYEDDIARCFNFILFSTLSGMSLLSLLVGYPWTLQHVREALPRDSWRHPWVMRTAYISTSLACATFTILTLLYLIPIAQDVWWDSTDPLTALFQIALPCIIYVIMLIGIRFAPIGLNSHLTQSQGFSSVQAVASAPPPFLA